jgi:hypothetical protein
MPMKAGARKGEKRRIRWFRLIGALPLLNSAQAPRTPASAASASRSQTYPPVSRFWAAPRSIPTTTCHTVSFDKLIKRNLPSVERALAQ